MNLNFKVPEKVILKPKIVVFGVGGAGGNAVNNMILSNLQGVTFVVANTDAQALEYSLAENKIQLGEKTTRGLGAGASPDVGKKAAEESMEQITHYLEDANMVFIAAGMGGGTGTGAAPVIAKFAKEAGILTVAVVTKPFHFEGAHRMRTAEAGLHELEKYVDTLIVIPNQNLFRIANEKTTFADAFKMADDVLHSGVRGVTDLMIMPGLINLDFADIKTIMNNMGKAMMGTGEASGEERAIKAAEAAISNPLLDHSSMKGAKGVLINITGGNDMTLFEVDSAANRIREEVGESEANIIFGSTFNPSLDGAIRVSVVATGIDSEIALAKHTQIIEEKLEISIQENFQLDSEIISENIEVDITETAEAATEEDFEDLVKSFKENIHKAETARFDRYAEEQPKPSFFARMKQGLWGKAEETAPRNPKASEKDLEYSEEDIYDIPAFLEEGSKAKRFCIIDPAILLRSYVYIESYLNLLINH